MKKLLPCFLVSMSFLSGIASAEKDSVPTQAVKKVQNKVKSNITAPIEGEAIKQNAKFEENKYDVTNKDSMPKRVIKKAQHKINSNITAPIRAEAVKKSAKMEEKKYDNENK